MRLFLSLVLVALVATPAVQAEKRLRGEKNSRAIEHDPEDVQRALKKLSVGRGAFTAPKGAGGINSALAQVNLNLARKGSMGVTGGGGNTKKGGAFAAATGFSVTTAASGPAPSTKNGGMGGGTRKGEPTTVAPATVRLPVSSPATSPATKGTKGTTKGSTTPKGTTTTKGTNEKGAKSNKNTRKGDGTGTTDMNQVAFFHLAPSSAVPVSSSDAEFDDIGTVFLYGGPLFDVNATMIPNANFTGVCTKTQQAGVIDVNRTLVGGGHCQFTYIMDIAADGIPLTTMNAVGEVFDLAGGVLAITGGTGDLMGAGGEVKVLPLYANGTLLFDFFTQAIVYEVNATMIF
mmetsp:Transcript_14378/g.23732  ORF Transcript_14378/g.23732 Transcript_14378/m.23732 type:complete len:346 (-) Transcript_14378:2068-3105(-)